MAEWVRTLNFSALNHSIISPLCPALATCETNQVLLAGVSGGCSEVLPFRPTYRLARLDMSEIILKETLNLINNNKKKQSTKIGYVVTWLGLLLISHLPLFLNLNDRKTSNEISVSEFIYRGLVHARLPGINE